MKHLITHFIIIAILAMVPSNKSFANKILGGKIESSFINPTGDSIRVLITLYEECGPNPICSCNTSNCQIQADVKGAGGNYAGQNFGTFNLSYVPFFGLEEMVDACPSFQSNCIPCGSGNAGPGSFNGVKRIRFSGVLNLNRFPEALCGFTISYSSCCRDSSIQVIQNPSNSNFYTELNINRCTQNRSYATLEAEPVFKVCSGVKTTIPLFRGSSYMFDSISYKSGKIKTAQETYVSYTGNYSELNPFPRAEFPAPLDLSKGYLEFTPLGVFKAPIAIDKYSWNPVSNAQYQLRDSSRIEFTIQSINCPANNVPVIRVYDALGNPLNTNTNPVDTVCNGLELCRIYTAYDVDPNDTTYFTKIGMGSFGESYGFTRLYDASTRHINGPRFDSIKVCWNTFGTIKNQPLFYSLYSNDGRCPIPGKSNFSGKIVFDNLGNVSLYKTMTGIKTANLDFYVSENNQINKDQSIWKIESRPGSDSFVTIIGSTVNNYIFPDSGLYKIKIGIQKTCGLIWVNKEIYISPIFAYINNTKNTSCNTSNDGRIEVAGTSMFLPVTYSINDSAFQSSGVFNNLKGGYYVIKIKDALNHIESISTPIYSLNKVIQVSISNYTPNTCKEDSIGSFSIQTSNGTGPVWYSLDSGIYNQNNVFSGLKNGSYLIEVRDSVNCYASNKFTVTSTSNLRGNAWRIKPVECFGDSNGEINLSANGQFMKAWFKVDTGSFQNNSIYDGLKKGVYQVQVKDSLNCFDRFEVEVPGSDSTLSLNFAIKQPACFEFNKGEINLVINGGTAPFIIYRNQNPQPTFDQTFTNLNPGNYQFTITDKNNCSITKNATIQQAPPKLNVLSEIDHVSCKEKNIGRIFIIPDGGVGPYMYKLNLDTFSYRREYTNLSAGKYFISIKDNKGCIKIEEVSINEPIKMSLSFVNTPESCNGAKNGTSVISVSNGVAPFSYMWNGKSSPNLLYNNNLGEGITTVKVTDSRDCTIEDSTYIRRLKPIENNGKICAISVDPLIGKNIIYVSKSSDSAIQTFDIFSRKTLSSPFEYITSLYGGTNSYAHSGGLQIGGFTDYYYVQAKDVCGNKTPFSSALNGIHLSITKSGNSHILSWKIPAGFPAANGFRVYEKTGNNPYQIIANLGSQVSDYSIPVQTNFQKQLTIELLSSDACEPNIKLFSNEVLISANSLFENEMVKGFVVYPNPSTGTFKISEDTKQSQISEIEVYQANGKLVKTFTKTIGSYDSEYDVSELSTGVYYLNIITQNKQHQNTPLFINHK
ncbi:MAG: T9SS type A sorting domain-containing protein [Bacteroidia bacterium]